jgi:hypothetical protein
MRHHLIRRYTERVLTLLGGHTGDFYLAGGTALSLCYFHHRQSLDLDFFSQRFSRKEAAGIMDYIAARLNKEVRLIAEERRRAMLKVLVYNIKITHREYLKIDFVEDSIRLIKPLKPFNGIRVLSLEDIYLRKIYAATGTRPAEDVIGARMTKGGRQEAKDLYDLYCLSHIFMPLSVFSRRYCSQLIRESLVRWFNTYDRLEMKSGLLELNLSKAVEYKDIDRHFKKEVDKMLDYEIGAL